MATSNIKLFDENKGNMLTDTEFNISTQRLNGLQMGVASSQLQNKAMYQASLVAYAIAQVMMQNGKNANDTDAVSTFVANLSGAMLQKVYDIATTAEAQAGVATGKWMSPALVKAAIDALAAKAQNILSDTTKTLYGLDSSAVPDDVFVKIKQKFSECVNPNLLDNWYFGNPVNQRGQTSYTGVGYGIDRWLSGNARGTFTVEADGITFSSNSSGTAYFIQFIENGFSLLKGKTVSLTILYADNSLVTLTGAIPTVSGEATIVTTNLGGGSFGLLLSSDGNLFVQLARLANHSIKVYAIKLELGSQQTLAYQDANSNWVLNEIPNYWEELLKCIQSTADASDTFANKTVLHTGNAQSLGFPKIAIGSYTGTGTHGSGNPNIINFGVVPKLALVMSTTETRFTTGGDAGYANYGIFDPNITTMGAVSGNIIVSFSGTTLSWYADVNGNYYPEIQQLNKSGVVYKWYVLY